MSRTPLNFTPYATVPPPAPDTPDDISKALEAAANARNNNYKANQDVLRYPLNVGDDAIFKHVLAINVYARKLYQDPTFAKTINDYEPSFIAGIDTAGYDANYDLGVTAGVVTGVNAAKSAFDEYASRKLTKKVDKIGKVATSVATVGAAAYAYSGIDLSQNSKFFSEKIGSIYLYVPDTMTFVDGHDYDAVSINEAMGLVGVVANVLDAGGGTEAAARFAASQAGGITGQGFVEASVYGKTGYALNPGLEVLYKKSKNREFRFQFKFAPRTKDETEEVISIIKTLRFHAAPQFVPANSRMMVPPSAFEIEFLSTTSENRLESNKHLPRIAKCALTNVDTNYAASGQFTTFRDGMPVEIDMQLTFTEMVVLTKQDIDAGY
jgi:hypothetical protein